MSGGCMFDGCGKPAPRRISDTRNGRSVPYCDRHYGMALDGFLHHVAAKGAYARSVGTERYSFSQRQLIGEYGTGGHSAPKSKPLIDWH